MMKAELDSFMKLGRRGISETPPDGADLMDLLLQGDLSRKLDANITLKVAFVKNREWTILQTFSPTVSLSAVRALIAIMNDHDDTTWDTRG